MMNDADFRQAVTEAFAEYIEALGPMTPENHREHNDGAHRLVGAVRSCVNHSREWLSTQN
jgi:hypothetical protein